MLTVSAAEFQRDFERYRDEARKQPLSIDGGCDGGECLVVLTEKEYRRLKRQDRLVFKTEELSDTDLRAILENGMDPRHDHLDAELEQTAP